jgi:hypothetical protein
LVISIIRRAVYRALRAAVVFAVLLGLLSVSATCADEIRHSMLVLGARTAIIDEGGIAVWEAAGGSRDGFVLPSGNVLVAWSDRIEELTRDGKVVFTRRLSAPNREVGTVQRLYNGNTLMTELGPKPRLIEISSAGETVLEVPLQPETDNAHMQTRMARQLRNGNFLVPHLLAFAVREYKPNGEVVQTLRTDLETIGGRPAENWPFTAIRLDNGHTLISLTHGNKVVELNQQNEIVWKVDNTDVKGLFRDPCGCQRLANGNTVIGSHGAVQGISMVEVTPERQIVWTSDHPLAAGVHSFQILTTNGQPEPGMPQK